MIRDLEAKKPDCHAAVLALEAASSNAAVATACASPSVLAQLVIVIASSQTPINFCAISDTSDIACISPAIMVADATSRIEKK
jgi:hypothetical protein